MAAAATIPVQLLDRRCATGYIVVCFVCLAVLSHWACMAGQHFRAGGGACLCPVGEQLWPAGGRHRGGGFFGGATGMGFICMSWHALASCYWGCMGQIVFYMSSLGWAGVGDRWR
jgi:hypothetical protein